MRRNAGFTLLEMLVALVVFGLLMAGIEQTLKFGLLAFRTTEPEDLAALDGALSQMIEQAVPGTLIGLPDRLSFTTKLPPGADLHDAPADVVIAMQKGMLILRYCAHPAGIPLVQLPPSHVELLATRVARLQFNYADDSPTGSVWRTNWRGGNPPLLVRIHIDFSDHHQWPDLVAAPIGGQI